MDKETALLVIGVFLLLAGIVGKVKFKDYEIPHIKSKFIRLIVGTIGGIFIILHLIPPHTVISVFGPETKIALEVRPFDVNTDRSYGQYLAMKAEKNLIELFANKGQIVISKRVTTSLERKKYDAYKLFGNVNEVDNLALIQVQLENPDGEYIAATEIRGSFDVLKDRYKVLPESLVYGLNIDEKTLTKKHDSKRPTISVEAFSSYLWALKKYREDEVQQAISSLSEAVRIDPKFAMALWTGSEILKKQRNTEKSEEWAKRAKSIDPDHLRWPYYDTKSAGNPVPDLLERLRKASREKFDSGFLVKKIYSKPYNMRIFAVWIDPHRYHITIQKQNSLYGNSVSDFLSQHNGILAINGGPYNSDREQRLTPVGLLIVNKVKYGDVSTDHSGSLIINNGKPRILRTRDLIAVNNYEYALQSRPLLVDPGGIFGINENTFIRANRSAVALAGNEILLVAISGERGNGLSLYEFAKILHTKESDGGFQCDVALNLDGGPSTQMVFEINNNKEELKGLWNVQNAIVVQPASR